MPSPHRVAAVLILLVAAACTPVGEPEATTTIPPATSLPAVETTSPSTTAPSPPPCMTETPHARPGDRFAFFSLCEADPTGLPYPVYRPEEYDLSLWQTVERLVAGTTQEERAFGLGTGFDGVPERDRIEVQVDVDDRGVATVAFLLDGKAWSPVAAATSDAAIRFLGPLYATVFTRREVTVLDSPAVCWGATECDGTITREHWQGSMFVDDGVLFHRGCTLLAAREGLACTVDDVPTRTRAVVVNVASDDVLNVRSGAGVAYFQVATLPPGVPVEVLDASDVASDGGLWRLVRSSGGVVGWVNAFYLDLDRTPEEALVDLFVAFAKNPVDATFAALPLADEVGLGLGDTIVRAVEAAALRRPSVWRVDLEGFRARSGSISVLDVLGRADDFTVTVGSHPHCASAALAAPTGYEDMTRIGVQPVQGLAGDCLSWFSVDFFVDDTGNVAAITLDLWEP